MRLYFKVEQPGCNPQVHLKVFRQSLLGIIRGVLLERYVTRVELFSYNRRQVFSPPRVVFTPYILLWGGGSQHIFDTGGLKQCLRWLFFFKDKYCGVIYIFITQHRLVMLFFV